MTRFKLGRVGSTESGSENNPNEVFFQKGWKRYFGQFDLEQFLKQTKRDPLGIFFRFLSGTHDLLMELTDTRFSTIANFVGIFAEINEDYKVLWNLFSQQKIRIPHHEYSHVFSCEYSNDEDLNKSTLIVDKSLQILNREIAKRLLYKFGKPSFIGAINYQDNSSYLYFPIEDFICWEDIVVGNCPINAYWQEHDVWAKLDSNENIVFYGNNLDKLINQAVKNLALIIKGYNIQIGKIKSQIKLKDFDSQIVDFTNRIIFDLDKQHEKISILTYGKPGTGKTSWVLALAFEIIAPMGYVIFEFDSNSVCDFVPPDYLDKVCIIVNEADNLAQDRGTDNGQREGKTERILSLLDGSLYGSLENSHHQSIIILLTCNTIERFDPAALRKGRIDRIQEFTTIYV